MKILNVYDRQRADTTGMYIHKSLSKRGNIELMHCSTREWKDMKDEYDLYLLVDDGKKVDWPEDKFHPSVYWAIDMHIDWDWRLERVKKAKIDHVFCAQHNAVQIFENEGISASWLPLACDPEVYGKGEDVQKKYDVCFVGHVNPGWDIMDKRVDFLDAIFKEFPNFFYGQRYLGECYQKYAESRIVLNISVEDDINMRCFEAVCSGSLLATNNIKGNCFEDVFADHIDLVSYNDVDDAIDKIKYYLQNDGDRKVIEEMGKSHVINNHTYDHRCDEMLKYAHKMGWIDKPFLLKENNYATNKSEACTA